MNVRDVGVNLEIPRTFDLTSTFTCGQCFRFEQDTQGKWHAVVFGKSLCLYETADSIVFENVSEEEFHKIWAPYFDLDTDYERFWQETCGSETLRKIVRECASQSSQGLHILQQEPWEALCSFLISQNNHIPRIRSIVRALCEGFGERIGENEFAFPAPAVLAPLCEANLAPLRCGYRAEYLLDAAKKVARGEIDLSAIGKMELGKARAALQTIAGVGPKVAECVLLYGFHRGEAFPVDVWMKRAMERFFPGESAERFGEFAGLAQQYIYAYSRRHPELFR